MVSTELSMGMSGDFEMAIRFGATYVRVGTEILRGKASEAALKGPPALPDASAFERVWIAHPIRILSPG